MKLETTVKHATEGTYVHLWTDGGGPTSRELGRLEGRYLASRGLRITSDGRGLIVVGRS